mmetsp:Transcript_24881/g.56295  ORF Transcript_24881/g.56295 Transcript_24881/m.56295 type:complete len:1783 (-) Transcript_24881:57-5405(-)
MLATPWFRQVEVLSIKNVRQLRRQPVHLFILIFSSTISVVFAWLAGRDARGPQGELPPLTDCGTVPLEYIASLDDPYYSQHKVSMNEAWRGGLPQWLMTLGPTFCGISIYLILRDELSSKRWGMLKAADTSAKWISWFTVFVLLSLVNSILGSITAVALPDIHVFESVNFGVIFGLLFFLHVALVSASFFLSAICGTVQSTALSIFIITVMIVASAAPSIATSIALGYGKYNANFSTDTGGSFWRYASTESWEDQYNLSDSSHSIDSCQSPIVSFEQSRRFKTVEERQAMQRDEWFVGCYTQAGASVLHTETFFLWFFIPQSYFAMAWGNVAGYTSLPGNEFSFEHASQSPESLSQLALRNVKGGAEYDQSADEKQLFSQGAMLFTEENWDGMSSRYYQWAFDENAPQTSNCPPYEESFCGEEDPYNPRGSTFYNPCANAKPGYPSSSPSVNDSLGLLFSLTVIYLLLAGYVSSVMPMGNGARLKPWFPFLLRYWAGGCRKGRSDRYGESDEEIADTDDDNVGIVSRNVRKRYGKVEALKPFSITMKPGTVTSLLGHNGAGKSTFANMLCCVQNPTGGDILVNGNSVTTDQYTVNKIIGECKQDDYIWPNLTAREHLELFAGIRGVSKAAMPAVVQKWLESVDLTLVQNQRVRTFSGGMKRRLSVAMSTIGNSIVVVLDEPTTGMDPVSRRYVWNHISEIKNGKTVLLTTHAMEEADLLSDYVAIMANGTIEAYGSPLDLKTKYGSALQVSLICDKEQQVVVKEAVDTIFADSLDSVSLKMSHSGYSTLTIKKVRKESGVVTLEDWFASQGLPFLAASVDVLNDQGVTSVGDLKFLDHEVFLRLFTSESKTVQTKAASAWNELSGGDGVAPGGDGVSAASLTSFVGWLEEENSPVQDFGISNSSLEEVFLTVTHNAPPPVTSMAAARGGCCSCCCGPRRAATVEGETTAAEVVGASTKRSDVHAGPKSHIRTHARKMNRFAQTKAIIRFLFARGWTGISAIPIWIIYTVFIGLGVVIGFSVAMSWPEFTMNYYFIAVTFFLSFMSVTIVSPIFADRNSGMLKSLQLQGMQMSSFLVGTSVYSFLVQLIYTFALLSLMYATSGFRTAAEKECSDDEYNCYTKFGDKPNVDWGSISVMTEYNPDDGESGIALNAFYAPGGFVMMFGVIVLFSLSAPGAVLSIGFLPGHRMTLVLVTFVILAICSAPSFLHISYLTDTTFMAEYTKCSMSMIETLKCQDIRSLSPDNIDGLDLENFVECLGYELTASYNPFLFCATPTITSILPQFGAFNALSYMLVSDIVFISDPPEYAVDTFIPLLEAAGASCSGARCRFNYSRELFKESLGWMALGSVLLLLLGVSIASIMVFPNQWVLKAKRGLLGMVCRARNAKTSITRDDHREAELPEVDQERQAVRAIVAETGKKEQGEAVEDREGSHAGNVIIEAQQAFPVLADVKAGTEAVTDVVPAQIPVLMSQLCKTFPPLGGAPAMIALDNLDLHVEKGEVIGLLGKNGAGKTTALKILAGIHDPTSGLGLVEGLDCQTDRNQIYARLGNCPQFDVVWPNQSVRRHLEFFARQKGIDTPLDAAHEIAEAVGLGAPEVYDRRAGALSGGMKRRLSIAISLLGAPSTLLLDEPTTGLDPSTRHEIWSLISSFATDDRAIIITTHMMLEADALANRIAIVKKGRLRVVGTQQHLKNTYGSGYLLQVNLSDDKEEAIEALLQFVRENIHVEAKKITKQARTIHINLPRDVSIQTIFYTLYSDEANKVAINQFLVAQSSLEDVFISVG